MFALIASKNPTWSKIRIFGNNRLLRSAFFWILIVPIAAKFLHGVESLVQKATFFRDTPISFSLPFSWSMFFYGALATAAANTIYLVFCPAIVKEYTTYLDYKNTGKGAFQLMQEFATVLIRYCKKVPANQLKNNITTYYEEFCVAKTESPADQIAEISKKPALAVRVVTELEVDENKLADAFWFVYDFVDRLCPILRFICISLYVIGLGFFLYVLFENVRFVILWQAGVQ